QRLGDRGVDIAAAQEQRQLTVLDAAAIMAGFMHRGVIDEDRVRKWLEEVLERIAASWGGARLRVYGEIVNLLWQGGDLAAAVRLEDLWNELIERRGFSLYCA